MATAKTIKKTIKNNKSINLDKPLELENKDSLVKSLRGQLLQARLKASDIIKENELMRNTLSKLRKEADIPSEKLDTKVVRKESNLPLKKENSDDISNWQFFKKNFLTMRFLIGFIFIFYLSDSVRYLSNSSKWLNVSTLCDFVSSQLKTFWNWITKFRINVPKGD